MRKFLGLDISTTKIGMVILDDKGEIRLWDYLNLSSSQIEKDLLSRSIVFETWVREKLRKEYNSDDEMIWGIEAPLFISPNGKTNANTITKLNAFNWMNLRVIYTVYGDRPVHINVNSARTRVFGKVEKGTDRKQYVLDKVIAHVLPSLKEVPKKYQTEISDAYVIARSLYEEYAGS